MDRCSVSLNSVAEPVGDYAVDAAAVHVALHGIGVCRSLVAGCGELLLIFLLIVPLVAQAFALDGHSDLKLLSQFGFYISRLFGDDGSNVVVSSGAGSVFAAVFTVEEVNFVTHTKGNALFIIILLSII